MVAALRLAVAQPLVVSHDLVGNVARHAEIVRSAEAQVVVFPELSLTGYEQDAELVDPADDRLAPLVRACRDTGAVALVGAPVAGRDGQAHIGVLRVDGAGVAIAYRKMWLGGTEAERFSPGDRPAVVEVGGWRLGLAVCKDTGVEHHAEAVTALGIDVYAAGVLESAADADVQPERARRVARRHEVWVAVASFAGSTGGGFEHAAGGSFVLAPDGEVAAEADRTVGAVVTAVLTT